MTDDSSCAISATSTLYVVDDDPAVRDALGAAGRYLGMAVETYASAETFLEQCAADIGGCLVLDVKMPGMDGLELQAALAERGICLPTIIISGHGDVPTAVSAMHKGALTFIEKPFGLEQISSEIAEALATGARWQAQCQRRKNAKQRLARITEPQREVLDLLTEGLSNQQIAARLGLSLRAVEDRKARLIQSLEAESLAEMLALNLIVKESPGPDALRPPDHALGDRR
jgi:FixJ family two-component response regulator